MGAFSVSNENGVAVVTFDLPGDPVNKLNRAVTEEFAVLLDRLREDGTVRAVVLISGKADTFIAGADIEEFAQLGSASEAEALSAGGQAMMDRIDRFPKPIVAAIHGACLGGGFELALACRWRIATDHPKTQVGLPEVQLGLIPGAGGCVRLPRLVGARAALDMILAGKSERAAKAYRLGMVDELVAPSILRTVAVAAADRLAAGRSRPRETRGGAAGVLLDGNPLGRQIVYRTARRAVLSRTHGHYPAPLAALEVVRIGLERGRAAGLEAERHRFGELAVSDVSRKLVQIFFATTALKKDDGVPPGAAQRTRPVARLGVIGSGFMGAGIAGTAVLNAEVDARMRDSELSRVGKGLRAATRILDDRLKRRRLTRPQHQRLSALLSGTADYSGFGRTDLIIEAVFEDLAVKRTVIAELERAVRPDTTIASNTSTIPIGRIAEGAERPERILGMHFFSPVEKMPLLEVIPHAGTAPDAVATAVRFGRKMGKTVIVVADQPGFWVNRILSPYLNEAGLLIREGVPIEQIDRAMTNFGFPVGPVALLDEVGLDVAQKASRVMHEAFGARLEPSDVVGAMVAGDRLGRKSGAGFYLYEGGHKSGVDPRVYKLLGTTPRDGVSPTTVEQRLVYIMLNEAALAEADGVLRSPRDGDIGAIYGIGFPPFRGGPLRMIDDIGPARVVEILNLLKLEFGDRFTPAPSLLRMAESGERYYE
jgi:3-hydroxyacyl-CoA dehydrogenase/enoyl-CoA hydratase/3-hydroxybutyryl-CoA epimerase